MTKKKQAELPTLERPTNKKLDEKIATYLEARKVHADSTTAITEAKNELTQAMHEADDAEQLQVNSDGDPVYVYRDGESEYSSVLQSSDVLKVKKLTPEDDPGGQLG